MRRSYLMRRPNDEDGSYDYGEHELLRAKPLDARLARNLGPTFSGQKDFVRASEQSQKQFYGSQTIVGGTSQQKTEEVGQGTSQEAYGKSTRQMSHDERNKISANILKAELRGDMERVRKLKRKLEECVVETENGGNGKDEAADEREGRREVLLLNMDKRSGIVMPAKAPQKDSTAPSEKRKGTVDSEFSKHMELRQMVAEEKTTTAEQQIAMFNRSSKVCSKSKTDDDWLVDDNMMSHPKKRCHEEKEIARRSRKMVEEHKFVERTLESCSKCINSKSLEKHSIVAYGLKTYLAVVNWDGLSPEHCYITPMVHCASLVQMDEDVYEEMKLWMKGLVAMWRDEGEEDGQDCVFVETAVNIREQQHMTIECIPLPKELGELAPIYFKKAIMESEKEWSNNQKLIDLTKASKASVRGTIPKGFPYFSVNFGLQPGFAHVIEDERKFPSNFAQEIIGGMLDLSHNHWRKPKRQSFGQIMERKNKLKEKWAKYDWTEIVRRELDEE